MALADEVATAGCRLSVCLSVCLPVARLLSQEGCVLVRRRGGKVGASVGRRGGAEALGWTAPPWLLVGLGTGQVSGRMGAQGPGWVAPRPTGGSEARGPRGSGGGRAESQTPPGRMALGSERDRGRPGSPSAAGPGEARGGGRQDLRAPQPTPQAPCARTPGMPLGVPEALRAAEPGQAFAGRGVAVFGGVAALAGRVWSRVVRLKYSACPHGEVRPAGPTGRSERKGGAAQGS